MKSARLKSDFVVCSLSPTARPSSKTTRDHAHRAHHGDRSRTSGADAKVIFSRNERDAYHDPGTPLNKTTPKAGASSFRQANEILLSGLGASPTGDHPFIDRFDLSTGKKVRVFEARANSYEVVEAVLDDSGTPAADPPRESHRTAQLFHPHRRDPESR